MSMSIFSSFSCLSLDVLRQRTQACVFNSLCICIQKKAEPLGSAFEFVRNRLTI